MPLLNPEGLFTGNPLALLGSRVQSLSQPGPVTEVGVGTHQAGAECLKECGPVTSPSAPVRATHRLSLNIASSMPLRAAK